MDLLSGVVTEDLLAVRRLERLDLVALDPFPVPRAEDSGYLGSNGGCVPAQRGRDDEPYGAGVRRLAVLRGGCEAAAHGIEVGLPVEECLVDDEQFTLRKAGATGEILELPAAGDDELSCRVGLTQPLPHPRLQRLGVLLAQTAVETDGGGVTDLGVQLATVLAGKYVLRREDGGGGDAKGEQEGGYPHQVGGSGCRPGGEFALEGAQDVGPERQCEHGRVGGQDQKDEEAGDAGGRRGEETEPGQAVVEAQNDQCTTCHRGGGNHGEPSQLAKVSEQDVREGPALQPQYPVCLGVEQDTRAGHGDGGEGDHGEGQDEDAVRVEGRQLFEGERVMNARLQAEVLELGHQRIGCR